MAKRQSQRGGGSGGGGPSSEAQKAKRNEQRELLLEMQGSEGSNALISSQIDESVLEGTVLDGRLAAMLEASTKADDLDSEILHSSQLAQLFGSEEMQGEASSAVPAGTLTQSISEAQFQVAATQLFLRDALAASTSDATWKLNRALREEEEELADESTPDIEESG